MSASAGLSVAEAAERLGISRDALRRRIDRKSIKATKAAAGTWRVHLAGDLSAAEATTGYTPDDTSRGATATTALLIEKDARIALLTDQLAKKDQQITDLSRQGERLQSLLGNEQETTHRLLAAGSSASPSPEPRKQPQEDKSPMPTPNAPQAGLWARILNAVTGRT